MNQGQEIVRIKRLEAWTGGKKVSHRCDQCGCEVCGCTEERRAMRDNPVLWIGREMFNDTAIAELKRTAKFERVPITDFYATPPYGTGTVEKLRKMQDVLNDNLNEHFTDAIRYGLGAYRTDKP